MNLRRKMERLEQQMPHNWAQAPEPWPVEDQLEDVLWALQVHAWGRSDYKVTDREMALLQRVEDLPEEARDLYERMDPTKQPDRERKLYEHWESAKRSRELSQKRIAWHHEHGWDRPTPEHLLPAAGEPPEIRGRAIPPGDVPQPGALFRPNACLKPAQSLHCRRA